MTKPSIIIPAAGLGRRMKSYGPKALIQCANDEPLICRQIRMCQERFKNPHIVVVLGFGGDRIKKVLPKKVHTVWNDEYEDTNVAYSIAGAMAHCPPWLPLLIVYGDLVFNKTLLDAVDLTKSGIVVDPDSKGRQTEVGVTVVGGEATVFSYGLPMKWAQIATLLYQEQSIFSDLMSKPYRRKHFSYEVFNEMLDQGGELATVVPDAKKAKLVEVDSSKDIAKARAVK